MQKPGIEMQARIESMNLATLYTQMIGSGSSEIANMGYQLLQPQKAQAMITWAYVALLEAPASNAAMTDGLREKLVISVKVLYVHAIDTKPSWARTLARSYFETLDSKYRTSTAYVDPGIETYVHEAYIAFLNKKAGPQTEEEIKKDNALRDILMRTESRDLAADLERYVDSGIMKHPENRGQVIDLAMNSILQETNKMEAKDYALLPERSEQLEKNADWGIRTLFYFARSGYPEAEHHLSTLWKFWLRTKTSSLADVAGQKLKAAYDLLILKHKLA
ncbi:hypothetical protein CROQUDRAFT_319061 [Cronartium quercuum f. sp. fusiforme G11]|uniref:Uncharacterized protein n=1 Tax=Cronartium quercuum f. sp. fusiforme G11 TaxID=708437 RepID=A0A9P6TF24_9BASI|nr:hypothetical protein CROQUDRAFT_319061 [Cronartium quercuum f. sp. fusiforme G11]